MNKVAMVRAGTKVLARTRTPVTVRQITFHEQTAGTIEIGDDEYVVGAAPTSDGHGFHVYVAEVMG